MFNSEKIKEFADFIKQDIKNISMVEEVAPVFIENKLYKELIELYRTEFFYSMNPLCFEKIGDVFFTEEKYEEALDSYMSCAECSENYSQIFEKLADVFGKLNDNDSRIACLEQIKIIKGNNG